jgi:hypothetical protein
MKMITNLLTLFVQVKEGYVECKKVGRSKKKPQLVVVFSELSAVNHLKNIHHLLLPCEVRLQKILISIIHKPIQIRHHFLLSLLRNS